MQTQYASHGDATCAADSNQNTTPIAMAIQFARARYIARSSGGSAVRSAAYNARDAITAERTGELYYFKHRDAPHHHEVLLPEGAGEQFRNASVLWNAAEAAEKRKDAQVAREIVLALPADKGINDEDRIELARSFATQHFVAKGLAVQLDVHAPHEGAEESERANWHAHLLITTRRIEGENFAAKKARDLDPEVRRAGGRAVVADAAAWGALWRDHQNRYFQEHGLDLRVDPTATHAGQHIGPVRMRKAESGIAERAELLRQANEAAARDPDQVLATLTRNNATFTERDLDRHLAKHLPAAAERSAVKAEVFEHQELVSLHDRATGEEAGRFTTRTVRAQEQAALRDAERLARRHIPRVAAPAARLALMGRTLRPDQQAAFDHALAGTGLVLIEGRAGTGKSYTLAAIRDAHAHDGRRVIGLAPTNAVAQDLAKDGFTEAGTVHAALFALKNGRTAWDRKTVVIVDEAAMSDARITGELLAAARQAGAKLILAGDDRQLASIERGGLFTELKQRHGAADISDRDAAARGLAAPGGARLGRGPVRGSRGGVRQGRRDHLDQRPGRCAQSPGRCLETRHGGAAPRRALRVRLHQSRRGRAERRAAPGAGRARCAVGAGRAAGDEARRGGLRHRRSAAVHRYRQAAADLQRQCRYPHRDRRA